MSSNLCSALVLLFILLFQPSMPSRQVFTKPSQAAVNAAGSPLLPIWFMRSSAAWIFGPCREPRRIHSQAIEPPEDSISSQRSEIRCQAWRIFSSPGSRFRVRHSSAASSVSTSDLCSRSSSTSGSASCPTSSGNVSVSLSPSVDTSPPRVRSFSRTFSRSA